MLLARFGRRIASQHRLGDLLAVIAEEVGHILDADRCTVFLVDHHKKQLWSRVAHGLDRTEIRMPLGTGVAGYVAQTGEVVRIKDAYKDSRFFTDMDRATGYKTRNILSVPLKGQTNEVLGVFQILNKRQGDFDKDDEGFLHILASIAASTIENAQLYEDLRTSQLETIYRLAMLAEFRDQEDTAVHLQHISTYCGILAEEMGFSQEDAENLRYAAPLHDIGKVAIPDKILRKPGKLTDEEYEEMKMHPVYGARVLEGARSKLLRLARDVSLFHHEKWDGSGYPNGSRGEEIPLEVRIVSIVDVFDALVSKRVYKPSWSFNETLEYLKSNSGSHFDPGVVDAFLRAAPKIRELIERERLSAGPENPAKSSEFDWMDPRR